MEEHILPCLWHSTLARALLIFFRALSMYILRTSARDFRYLSGFPALSMPPRL